MPLEKELDMLMALVRVLAFALILWMELLFMDTYLVEFLLHEHVSVRILAVGGAVIVAFVVALVVVDGISGRRREW